MGCCEKRLILASASPRRRELLERFGLAFEILPARSGEEAYAGEGPGEYVKKLARSKAEEVMARCGDARAVLIAADTVVEYAGELLGKPRTEAEAFEMLSALSGRTHRVWSGLCVREGEREALAAECTEVTFRSLSETEIRAYIATGEPMDKAGAYGYQARAGLFVEGIRGDFFNVMGLPLCRLGQMLREFGISLL